MTIHAAAPTPTTTLIKIADDETQTAGRRAHMSRLLTYRAAEGDETARSWVAARREG